MAVAKYSFAACSKDGTIQSLPYDIRVSKAMWGTNCLDGKVILSMLSLDMQGGAL